MSDSRIYDLFISCAHLDNQPLFKDQEGWISSFHYSLNARLGQLLGRKPHIWHDKILQGNDRFNDEIVGKLSNTKIFLAVISPCYLRSEWCMKELREFIKAAGAGRGINIGNKSRIFKIVKTLVPHELHPDEIRELLGYEFFLKDERGRPHECSPERESTYYQKYLDELENVAFDIRELIKEMERENLEIADHEAQPSSEDHKDRKDISIESLRKPPAEYSFEALDRELIARGAQVLDELRFGYMDKEGTPQRDLLVKQLKELYASAASLSPDKALSHISTNELVKILMIKSGKIGGSGSRGIWLDDDRKDFFEIEDEQVKKNAGCVAVILNQDGLIENKEFSTLKVKNYGKSFNLIESEPFNKQPIVAGRVFTGFLVKEDVIATAGQCTNESNVTDLRIFFGFKMLDPSTPITQIPNENVYRGVKIVRRVYNSMRNKSDWALVKLDRKVVGQSIAKLSRQDIFIDQPVYVIGHPVGLPLKYAPGARVKDIKEAYFEADLDVYSGNSGSPVFKSDTHEVIGIVVRGYSQDFRWTGKGWASVIYPNTVIQSPLPQCTRVSEFIKYCR